MLNYEFPPLGGGTGNASRFLLQEFAGRPELAVDLVTSSATESFEDIQLGDRVRIIRLPVGKKSAFFWTAGEIFRWVTRASGYAARLVGEHDYEICHCWSGWPAGLIGYRLRNHLPYLVALRGSDVPGYNPRLRVLDPLVFRHLSRRIWRHAAAVTCVSQSQARLAAHTAPWLQPVVIGNGVDTQTFQPGTPPDTFTILFVGRLIERKNVASLVRAVAELCKTGHDCRLVIAGTGPEHDRLARLAEQAGVGSRVEMRGRVAHEDLPELYASASVFALPALQEAMSNALLEAMAAGLPLVTTPNGITDLMDDNGAIVPAGDLPALVDALRAYIETPEQLHRHGSQSRRIAMTIGWGAVADAYQDLYASVITACPGTRIAADALPGND